MRTRKVTLDVVLALTLALAVTAPAGATALAAQGVDQSDLALVDRYAPVLYFHPDELFRPQPVDVLLSQARLRKIRTRWRDATVLTRISGTALARRFDANYYFDIWLGDRGSSDCRNYSSLREYYRRRLSPSAGGPPIMAYAHVLPSADGAQITIQYWFFYFYNDWLNKHEGDWEMIQVVLDAAGQPEWAVYSQHGGGTRRSWRDVPVEAATHPVVYVALGSHANYFCGDEAYAYTHTVGASQVEVVDRTGRAGRVIPQVLLFDEQPDAHPLDADSPDMAWLFFPGGWGETAAVPGFSGPVGPKFKGSQWDTPDVWGLAQPLDLETWYTDRLRIEVQGADAELSLMANDPRAEDRVETSTALALFHGDLQPGDSVRAEIRAAQCDVYDVALHQPDPAGNKLMRYIFRRIPCSDQASTALLMRVGEVPKLLVAGRGAAAVPVTYAEENLAVKTLDFVWLPASISSLAMVRGAGASVAAGLLPPLFLLWMLYYADRYEKEPAQLLLGAFAWGAIPAFVIALVIAVFFQLPVDLLGRDAVEAIRAGMLSPLIEESAKGVLIFFIIWRYRREIDGVVDGVVYGAAVGLGFAMMSNTLSYGGAFLLRGFAELQHKILIEGFFYGLNHALYSGILGACLAYGLFARSALRRRVAVIAAFPLAILCNGLHNAILSNTSDVNALGVVLSWLGLSVVVAVAVWSLHLQRERIDTQLAGEVPALLRCCLTSPRARFRAEWRALMHHGPAGWRRTRRIYQLCAELAFLKSGQTAEPDNPHAADEIAALRQQLATLLASECLA